ncbi:AbrB/MazE/SpoVT family DNA-binding domain-containing protein [Endozoicomonas sp. ONNA2]|uniref:AbrB/MazE/SpoVT family DNA-binding domain-containing protein n=1 Tax=Endozoicomonas sp. ONNA2 TaxID=2828741 RepID=UPI002148FA1F|nr:AbrB/MazE/SpoVT family DNA-binding domain-containing protein [Endozoicomonas sp. ONNA2]
MQTEIKKWGNSAAVRLPAKALAQAGIEINSSVEIVAVDGEIILKPIANPTDEYTLDDLLAIGPDNAFDLQDDEDREWLNDDPGGQEML